MSWMSPSAGDVYASGNTMVGQWKAGGASGFVEPSFSLCEPSSDELDDDSGAARGKDNCGQAVWPMIDQDGGSYLVYL